MPFEGSTIKEAQQYAGKLKAKFEDLNPELLAQVNPSLASRLKVLMVDDLEDELSDPELFDIETFQTLCTEAEEKFDATISRMLALKIIESADDVYMDVESVQDQQAFSSSKRQIQEPMDKLINTFNKYWAGLKQKDMEGSRMGKLLARHDGKLQAGKDALDAADMGSMDSSVELIQVLIQGLKSDLRDYKGEAKTMQATLLADSQALLDATSAYNMEGPTASI